MKSELNLGVLFTGKLDATFDSVINRIQNSIGKLEGATAKVTAAQKQQQQGTLSLQMGLKSYIQDVEKLLQIQVRWYGAKMLLFAAVELPLAAIKNIVQYGGEVDKARSEMLRWAATSGTVSQQVIKDTDEIIKAIRKATTEYPVDFADMSKSAQAFLGAGIKYGTVKDMIPDLAKLRTAFKEIGIDDFAVAMTGFFKTFKDSIIEGATEAEKFKKILNSLLAAQAEGIIRPEQFTKVIQYLGNITYLSGFSVDQMLALSVAITDSGIRASSAARTFSGLLTTLQGTNAAKVLFEKFGITIDRNRVFAEQFFEIIKKMREKIGEGPITVGWLQAIFKITSVEQGRALAALINQFATVEPLLTKLKNASKGLDLAADIMKNNLPDQLKMIVNMIKEMGFSIGANAIPSLKAFVGSLWEVGRGVLAAIDPTGVFTDKIEGFSSASMRAYEATHNLLGALSSVGSV